MKFGLPRWKCRSCRRTFRRRRVDTRDRCALAAYVRDRSTYQRLSERWGVSKSAAYGRVQRALAGRGALIARTAALLPRCDGMLVLDGKHLRILGGRHTLFVAWDRGLGLPVHFILAEGGERELWYWRLVLDLRRAGYVPKAFVSDGIPTLAEFLSETYPDLPHQRCAVHAFLRARSMAARRGRMAAEDRMRASLFVELLRHVLWSRDLAAALRKLARIGRLTPLLAPERRALAFVRDALGTCFVATDGRWKSLRLPRSSNAIENVIGQVEARLKTRRGTKSRVALERLVNELLLEVSRQTINQ